MEHSTLTRNDPDLFWSDTHLKMTSATGPPCKIFTFHDAKCSPDPVFEIKPECLHPSPVPIVVDNGSFQTRAGWACKGEEFSLPVLLFKSVAARSRGAARSETQVGNDIPNLEPLRWLLKSQFDRNVVVNFEIQELMLDYIFLHLGIGTEVGHELVYTCCVPGHQGHQNAFWILRHKFTCPDPLLQHYLGDWKHVKTVLF